jgi:hypothetical protein
MWLRPSLTLGRRQTLLSCTGLYYLLSGATWYPGEVAAYELGAAFAHFTEFFWVILEFGKTGRMNVLVLVSDGLMKSGRLLYPNDNLLP